MQYIQLSAQTHRIFSKRGSILCQLAPQSPRGHISQLFITAVVQATTDGTESQSASRGPRAICGFRDGSLTVANVRFGGGTNGIGCNGNLGLDAVTGGSIPWASKAGHIETVFTCAHRPGDADTLATGSYGSSVKVWHTPTMDLKVGAGIEPGSRMGWACSHFECLRS